MRLTGKNKMTKYGYEYIAPNRFDNFGEGCNKLGQLEDIEEKLGIDLITLFKALERICIKPNNIYVGSPYLCFSENENRKLEFQFKIGDIWYKVKDYGKTWALTKEELC